MGSSVRIWAFNNVPLSVDGTDAPQDGARSLYPEFEHYTEVKQENIDSSDRASELRKWLWKSVFIDEHAYRDRPGPVGEWCVRDLQPNIVRLEYMEELAMEHLSAEIKAGRVSVDTFVLFMSPEMIVPAFDLDLIQWATEQKGRALVIEATPGMGTLGKAGHHDGLTGARADTILQWWRQKTNPTRRFESYEQWYKDSLRDIAYRAIGSCEARPRLRCFKPGAGEEPLPWHPKLK